MPELPEVETTVRGLKKSVIGLKITDVWSDYFLKTSHGHKPNVKNKEYFRNLRKNVVGKKILGIRRVGKNILMDLEHDLTLLTHLKMTGHYLYGKYRYDEKQKTWLVTEDGPLKDPYNRFIHLVFVLSNKKHLVLSDVRRFAKVILIDNKREGEGSELGLLGPDPLSRNFGVNDFIKRVSLSKGPIKAVLMDQRVISGIGNIYSDEMLWSSGIHPEEKPSNISPAKYKKLYLTMLDILKKSLGLGGDSTSDYRRITGEPGGFQKQHKVYRLKGERCQKSGCQGVIDRIMVRGRSAHYCLIHQKKC